jgi:hypothetical protein
MYCNARCYVTRCEGPRCTRQLYCWQMILWAYGEEDEASDYRLLSARTKKQSFVPVCMKCMKWHCGTPRGICSLLSKMLMMLHHQPATPPTPHQEKQARPNAGHTTKHHASTSNSQRIGQTFPLLLLRVPHLLTTFPSGFRGLLVSMLASGTQVRGFKPGWSRRICRAKKSQHAFLQRGSKAVCPMS